MTKLYWKIDGQLKTFSPTKNVLLSSEGRRSRAINDAKFMKELLKDLFSYALTLKAPWTNLRVMLDLPTPPPPKIIK